MIKRVKYIVGTALLMVLACESERTVDVTQPGGQALPKVQPAQKLLEDPRLIGRALLQQKRYVDALGSATHNRERCSRRLAEFN